MERKKEKTKLKETKQRKKNRERNGGKKGKEIEGIYGTAIKKYGILLRACFDDWA